MGLVYLDTYFFHKFKPNVGKYTSPMDPMDYCDRQNDPTPRNHLFFLRFPQKIPPSSVFPRSCPGKWGVKIHEISKCNTGRGKKPKTRTIFTFGIIIRKVMMRTQWWWFWGVLACVSELGHDLKFKRQKRVVGFMTLKACIVYHRYASNICKLQCRIHDMHSLWECHRVGEKDWQKQ